MRRIIFYAIVIIATSFISCNNNPKQSQVLQDSMVKGVSVLKEKNSKLPSDTESTTEGFGRCLESGCYCKAFKGRGQTCANCGHAYRRHY